MTAILLGLVYLAVVLVIFWSVHAERLPTFKELGPFAIRSPRPSRKADQPQSKLPNAH